MEFGKVDLRLHIIAIFVVAEDTVPWYLKGFRLVRVQPVDGNLLIGRVLDATPVEVVT